LGDEGDEAVLTLVIFGTLVAFLLLGVPIAISMGLTAVLTFIFMGEGFVLPMVAQRMYSSTTAFTLLAIPFFILAGNLMNTGGITRRVFRFALALVGHLRGGLGHVNVVSSMIFSGMSGAAVADAAGLGLVELEAMTKSGYDRRFSAAITAASSTIGPVVPPSIPFVIYGSITGVSVGKLFLAGCTPGVLMGVAMMVAVYFVSRRRNYPKEAVASFKELISTGKEASLALGTPVIVIGGILGGIFTPTEAAVVASVYALFLGLVIYRELTIQDLPRVLWDTLVHTIRVMFIISAAGFFGWLLIHQRIPDQVITGLTALTSIRWVLLLIIIFILLVLGCFLEGIAVLVITIPVFMPLIERYGIDPVQFGVIMILCSMLGLLTPPVGMSLYAVSSISGVSIGPLTREMWPYLLGIFVVLLIMSFIPQMSLWLPSLLMGP
jgi:tripartite ATP-independent transporter DctM subunit